MKYAKVSRDGQYTPPPASNSKASYSTMVYVRATIVEDAGWHLARAATISVSTHPQAMPCRLLILHKMAPSHDRGFVAKQAVLDLSLSLYVKSFWIK